MGISKSLARSVKHAVLAGDEQVTGVLDATTTTQTVELTGPTSRVTVQTSDTLAGTVEYSANGKDFFGSTALVAGVPVTYTTHNVAVVKITRSGGSGRATILAV